MKRYSYGERDYAFGQMMLTLRTSIGLTQAGLAERLRVSRRAVAEWEAGSSYPKAEHLKQVIALGVRASAFHGGREAEEIRALWKATHQKVLLDESWLAALLGKQHPLLALMGSLAVEQTSGTDQVIAPPALGPRVDWGDALAVSAFYGRKPELALLTEWVAEERCRVVSVLGMGGIGKSAPVVSLMHRLAPHFEVVIWRSLRDAPAPEALLDDCLQVLAPHLLADVPTSLERRLGLLLEYLRGRRALLVLDNLETLLEEGEGTGRMRAGYEGYGRLLRRVAQTEHQSCLLLTSREKPSELVPLDGALSVDFAPDGGLLASGGNDATVQLWDRQSGTPLQTLSHPSPILSVAWSPDGRLLASGSFDGCIRLWERQNWTCVAILAGHTNRVRGLAFAQTAAPWPARAGMGPSSYGTWKARACVRRLQGIPIG